MKRRLALLISVLYFVALAHAGGAQAFAQGARGGGGRVNAAQVLKLAVDATDAPRKLFRATEVIHASPGPLTLYYPAWLESNAA